jgi:hypothetical protein
MDKILALITPVLVYGIIFVQHASLPGRWVDGYVTRPGSSEKLRYRLNGLMVLFTVVLIWVLFGFSDVMDWDWL